MPGRVHLISICTRKNDIIELSGGQDKANHARAESAVQGMGDGLSRVLCKPLYEVKSSSLSGQTLSCRSLRGHHSQLFVGGQPGCCVTCCVKQTELFYLNFLGKRKMHPFKHYLDGTGNRPIVRTWLMITVTSHHSPHSRALAQNIIDRISENLSK
jgi:hypothetical protein